MLTLTRKRGQSIYIGDEVKVVYTGFDRGQVKLTIHAPYEIPIHREEIYMKIQEQKRIEMQKLLKG